MAITSEFFFPSSDGKTLIHVNQWTPSERRILGVVQIAHGVAEYGARYAPFARFLCGHGFVVVANDHLGHGQSLIPGGPMVYLGEKDGWWNVVDDMECLRSRVAKVFPDRPYFLFGHSMGSFITRAYLARHGAGLAGAVICGTGNQPLALSKAGHALAMLLCHLKGADYCSPLLDSMGAGGFARAIENPRTPLDWISVDPAVVDAYLADEMCGQMFSVGAYATLTSLTGEVVTLECARRVPPQLPLLFIAGAQDPVGDCGKGVKAAADLARKAGSRDVRLTLYEGMRHEILNEPEKARVYQDVLAWLKEQM